MILRHRSLACAFVCIGALAAACAKAKPPVGAPLTIAASPEAKIKASMTLTAAADTNPDASGRPSPIIVRVYQLRTDAAFSQADFFALFDDDQKVLGPEMISRDEYSLTPAERRTIEVTLSGETRFVGAIAAFRDIRNAQWRMLVPASRKGLTVTVERLRVVLSGAAN